MKNDNLWKNEKQWKLKVHVENEIITISREKGFSGQKLFFSRPLLNFPSLRLNPYENKGP